MEYKISRQGPAQRSRPARMPIGPRLRQLREQRGLSQGDIGQRAGFLTCYISRVENGYKLPSLRTLERFALALDVPLYKLFYDGEEPPPAPHLTSGAPFQDLLETEEKGSPNTRFDRELGRLWGRLGHFEHQFLLHAAKWLGTRSRGADEKNNAKGMRLPGRGRPNGKWVE